MLTLAINGPCWPKMSQELVILRLLILKPPAIERKTLDS